MFNVCAGRAGAAYTNGKLLLLVVNISSWAMLVEMKTFKIDFQLVLAYLLDFIWKNGKWNCSEIDFCVIVLFFS